MDWKSKKELAEWFRGVPNKLTIARILSIPFILLLYPLPFFTTRVICALVFLAAALTDFLDGYLARRYEIESKTGALLDPIADKMLVITGLISVVSADILYAWVAVLLICREVAVSGMRLLALEHGQDIKVSSFGKAKTAAQLTAIFCLLIGETWLDIPFRTVGMLAIYLALGLSLYSGYLYWQEFWQQHKVQT